MCVKGSICWKQMSQWVSVSPPLLCAPRRSASLHTPLGLTVPCRRAERERAPSPPRPRQISPRFSCSVFFFFFSFSPLIVCVFIPSLWLGRESSVYRSFSWLFVPNRVSRAAFGSRCARRTKTRLILGVRGAETCRSVDGRIVTVETVLNIYVFSTHVRSSSFYYSTAVCARAATERGIYEPYSGAYTCSQRHSSLTAEILQVSH